MLSKDSLHVPNTHSTSAEKMRAHLAEPGKGKCCSVTFTWTSFWDTYFFFYLEVWKEFLFPSLGHGVSFPKHYICAARLALTSRHPTHSRGKKEQATGSDSALNSAARQLQASCPHTCTHAPTRRHFILDEICGCCKICHFHLLETLAL